MDEQSDGWTYSEKILIVKKKIFFFWFYYFRINFIYSIILFELFNYYLFAFFVISSVDE